MLLYGILRSSSLFAKCECNFCLCMRNCDKERTLLLLRSISEAKNAYSLNPIKYTTEYSMPMLL